MPPNNGISKDNSQQPPRSHPTPTRSPNNGMGGPLPLIKRYRVEVAASASSVLSSFTAFPLDSVKTRMQTYNTLYSGFTDCVVKTYKQEKLRGFFRGVTSPMASITLVRTISFSVYQRSKASYCDIVRRNFGYDVMGHVTARNSVPNLWTIGTFAAAGATAGSCITFLACPFELTKLSAQVSTLAADKTNAPTSEMHKIAASYQGKGTVKTMANLVKHRGFLGLWTGVRLHFMRDTIGTATYFVAYESSKQLLTRFGGDGAHSNPLAVLAAGGFCGVVSWALIYPIDSAKSQYQRDSLMYAKGQKVPPVAIKPFHRKMYSGLGVSVARSCIVNAVFFSSFEFLKKRIKALDDE